MRISHTAETVVETVLGNLSNRGKNTSLMDSDDSYVLMHLVISGIIEKAVT